MAVMVSVPCGGSMAHVVVVESVAAAVVVVAAAVVVEGVVVAAEDIFVALVKNCVTNF